VLDDSRWWTQTHFAFGLNGIELCVAVQTATGDGRYPVYAEFGPYPSIPDCEVIRRIEVRFV